VLVIKLEVQSQPLVVVVHLARQGQDRPLDQRVWWFCRERKAAAVSLREIYARPASGIQLYTTKSLLFKYLLARSSLVGKGGRPESEGWIGDASDSSKSEMYRVWRQCTDRR